MQSPEARHCPRCKNLLHSRVLAELSVAECSGCAGLWVTTEVLEQLCRRAHLPDSIAASSLEDYRRSEPDTRAVYLRCPDCTTLMMRRTIATGTGVIVDTCKRHGLWLDHGELEKILAFVRQRGVDELAVLKPRTLTVEEKHELDQERRRRLVGERDTAAEYLFDMLIQLGELLASCV